MADLKPCPFCGGKAVMKHSIAVGSRSPDLAFVECSNGCVIAKAVPESVNYCAVEEAAKIWNSRKAGE